MNRASPSLFDLAPQAQILLVAVLFSTGGAVIKATSFSGWQVAGLRCAIAGLTIALLLPASRRNWNRGTLLVGCAYAGALITYAVANKLTTAANTIFLYSTSPLHVLYLAPVLLREPMRRRDLVFTVAFALGLSLVLSDTKEAIGTAVDPVLGNWIALFGGFSFALVVLGLRWLSRGSRLGSSPAASSLLAGNVIAAAVALPLGWPIGHASAVDWMLVTYLGVFQVGLAYLLFARALHRVRAFEASLLLLIEPVLNPIWAWWLHGERPGARALVGGTVILVTTATMAFLAGRGAVAAYGDSSSGQ